MARPPQVLLIKARGAKDDYRQIMDAIVAAYYIGEIKIGDRIDSIEEMGEGLDITKMSVARAYKELADQGMVKSELKLGTRIVGAPSRELALEFMKDLLRDQVVAGRWARIPDGVIVEAVRQILQSSELRTKRSSEDRRAGEGSPPGEAERRGTQTRARAKKKR